MTPSRLNSRDIAIEKFTTGIITALMTPVIILNFLAGIVGGIWLMATGQWPLFIGGLVYMFIGANIIGILILPQLLIAMPAVYFTEKKNYFMLVLFSLLSVAYLYTLIAVSSYLVSNLALNGLGDNTTPLWASLLWLYAVVLSPWQYMASKERDNESTGTTTFGIAFGLFILILCIGLFGMTLNQAFPIFVITLLIPLIFQMTLLIKMTASERNEFQDDKIIEIETENENKRSWKDLE